MPGDPALNSNSFETLPQIASDGMTSTSIDHAVRSRRVPLAGEYHYEVTQFMSLNDHAEPLRTELGTARVGVTYLDPASQGRREVYLPPDPDESTFEATLHTRRTGDFLARTRTWLPSGIERCAFAPPLLHLPKPLVTGERWRAEAQCKDAELTFEGYVTHHEIVNVGNADVRAIVIERTITVLNARGLVTVWQKEWYSEAHGLILKVEERQSDAVWRTKTRQLRSLHPS